MRLRHLVIAVLAAVAAPSAFGAETHAYHSERSALLPVPVGDTSGLRDEAGPQLGLAISSVGSAPGAPAEAGVHMPRGQLSFLVQRALPSGFTSWRFLAHAAPAFGAIPIEHGTVERPVRWVGGAGTGLVLDAQDGAAWVTAGADLTLSAVPSEIRLTCLDCYAPPGSNPTRSGTMVSLVPGANLQLSVGMRIPDGQRAGVLLALRFHPQLDVEPWDGGPAGNRAEIRSRPMFLPGLGWGVRSRSAVWSIAVFQPIDDEGDVRLGPVLALSITPRGGER